MNIISVTQPIMSLKATHSNCSTGRTLLPLQWLSDTSTSIEHTPQNNQNLHRCQLLLIYARYYTSIHLSLSFVLSFTASQVNEIQLANSDMIFSISTNLSGKEFHLMVD